MNKKVTWSEEDDLILKNTIDERPRDIVKKLKNNKYIRLTQNLGTGKSYEQKP